MVELIPCKGFPLPPDCCPGLLHSQHHLYLLEYDRYVVPNSLELDLVDVSILMAFEAKVYRDRRITTLDETMTIILDELEAFPYDHINILLSHSKCLDKDNQQGGHK